jgi:hypothetical protein
MTGTIIALILVACVMAAIALAKYISAECAVRSLVRAAKEEHRRTLYIFDDVPHGDVVELPSSALISRMPQPGRV